MNKGEMLFKFFLVFSVLLLVSGMVSAACSNPNQAILRLSAAGNAHGQLATGQSPQYTTEVCYNDIFGSTYSGSFIQTCSVAGSGGNEVLRLSSPNNAHGDGPNTFSYTTRVCYGDLVCALRSGSCIGTEREVVALSSLSGNAHIETATNNQYTGVICCSSPSAGGGGPTCGPIDSSCPAGCSAANDGDCPAITSFTTNQSSLAGTGNILLNWATARVSSCSASASPVNGQWSGSVGTSGPRTITNLATTTTFTLTCSGSFGGSAQSQVSVTVTPSSGAITQAQWRQPGGSSISNSFVNQTVRLFAQTTLTAGRQLRFEVYEEDPIPNPDDPIRVGAGALAGPTAIVASDGTAYVDWLITDTDMVSGGVGSGEGAAEFYFNVSTTTGTSASLVSGILDTANTLGPNTPPIANISAPKNKAVYFRNVGVIFNQTSVDTEGFVGARYLWTIAEDNYQNGNHSFNYTFTTPGIKTITLKVTDAGGLSDEDQVSILITGSPGALAYISAPTHKQVIPAQQVAGQLRLIVNYNGSQSYVIDNNLNAGCTNRAVGITCIAGPCPAQTENAPAACAAQGSSVPIVPGSNPNFLNSNFSWSFDDGQRLANGTGIGAASGQKVYGSSFARRDRAIDLILDYREGSTSVSAVTQRLFTLSRCLDNGATWIDFNQQTGRETRSYDTALANGACVGSDGLNGTLDDCCITGRICGDGDGNSETAYQCYLPVNTTIGCPQYSSQVPCDNAPQSVVRSDRLWETMSCGQVVNGTVIECSCAWNVTTNVCALKNQGTGLFDPNNQWSCLSSYVPGQCTGNYMNVFVNASFNPGTSGLNASQVSPACISGPRSFICGTPAVELPFFGYSQFIAALILVAIVYVFIAHRKKTRR